MIVVGSGATCTVRGTATPTLTSKSTCSTRGALEVSTFWRIVVFCSVVSETFLEVIGRSFAPCLVLPLVPPRCSVCDCCLLRSPRSSVCDCCLLRSPRGCSPCDCWFLDFSCGCAWPDF